MRSGGHRAYLFSWAAAALLGQGVARGDGVDLPASRDATIFGGVNTTNSSGAGPAMFAGTDGNGSPKRGLIAFDLSQIPVNSVVTGVTLTMYLAQAAGSGGSGGGGDSGTRMIRLYRLTSNWGDGTTGAGIAQVGGAGQGWPAQVGDATWNDAFYKQTGWNTPGGDFVGDHETTVGTQASAEGAVGTTMYAGTNWSSPGMIADVQSWLDMTTPNDGWILKNDAESGTRTFRAFWTKEGAAANWLPGLAPQLAVTYIPPAAAGATWIAHGTGDWQTAGNWSAAAPNGSGDFANFTSAISGPATVALTAPVTLGTINFSNASSYTISGAGITLQGAGTSARINVILGSHVIASAVALDTGVTLNFANAGSLALSGKVCGSGGITVTGTGTLTLSGANTYRGGTIVDSGTLAFASAAARPAGDRLTIGDGATVVVESDAANVDAYRTQIGSGAISGGAAIGYMTGAQYNGWHGTALDPAAVILQGTRAGDVDLDGQIGVRDFVLLDEGYLQGWDGATAAETAHWVNGDFNDDGVVNYLDFALIDASYAASGGAGASGQVVRDGQQFGARFISAYQADLAGDAAAIPEAPTWLTAAGGLLLLGGRWRPGAPRRGPRCPL